MRDDGLALLAGAGDRWLLWRGPSGADTAQVLSLPHRSPWGIIPASHQVQDEETRQSHGEGLLSQLSLLFQGAVNFQVLFY